MKKKPSEHQYERQMYSGRVVRRRKDDVKAVIFPIEFTSIYYHLHNLISFIKFHTYLGSVVLIFFSNYATEFMYVDMVMLHSIHDPSGSKILEKRGRTAILTTGRTRHFSRSGVRLGDPFSWSETVNFENTKTTNSAGSAYSKIPDPA